MARPSSEAIEKYNIIQQFQRYCIILELAFFLLFFLALVMFPFLYPVDVCNAVLRCGVKTVINLQRPGEHASCGFPLEPESGFTYRPETFMEAGSEFHIKQHRTGESKGCIFCKTNCSSYTFRPVSTVKTGSWWGHWPFSQLFEVFLILLPDFLGSATSHFVPTVCQFVPSS